MMRPHRKRRFLLSLTGHKVSSKRLALKISRIIGYAPVLLLTGCALAPVPSSTGNWSLDPVSVYDSGYGKGTEIVSVQPSPLRAVLSNSETGEVDVLDISHPERLHRKARVVLQLSKGEELTSVAFHPNLDVFAAVIDAGARPGRLEIRSATTGLLIDRIIVGFGPDAVVFSQDGKLALIANEGEDFLFEPSSKQFFTPEGSISMVGLSPSGHIASHKNLNLANALNHEGFKANKSGRFMEREIDWNGDGIISNSMDFDGNGKIENKKVMLGWFEGQDVYGTETKGEEKILIPISTHSPALLEPEYIAITPDSKKAYVTLQENNAVAVVDLIGEQVVSYYDLGITQHKTDAHDDGKVKFEQLLTGLREPDGIALAANGRYFVTADEGDTDSDNSGQPLSGGRSVSVFDAVTGSLLGDTGNQVDEVAFANKVYPEQHSSQRGSEPEMLVSLDLDGVAYVAVGLEKAGSVELVSLAEPFHPKVAALAKISGDKGKSPEGIAHFLLDGEHYLLTANEMSGTVDCFKVIRQDRD